VEVWTSFVEICVAVTVAPGTAAPLASVTVPVMDAVVPWAGAVRPVSKAATSRSAITAELIDCRRRLGRINRVMLPPKKTITGNTLSSPMLLDLLKLRSPESYSRSQQYYASPSQPSPTKLG
jgi:hypothetical protein